MDKEEVIHIYNGILISHKNNEILPLATSIDLEGIMLSEISQTNTIQFHLIVESETTNKQTKQKPDLQKQRPKGQLPQGREGWVKQGRGNIVNNIVVGLHSDRWLLALVR